MEKIDTRTPDIAEENIEKLIELFPQVATEVENAEGEVERAIDFDALRDLLGDVAEGQRERYQFTWPGKREAKAEARRPIDKTMIPCPEKSVDWETTQNIYIEGDNLDALKLLRETYAGKIKLIYIDPPYNTGQDLIYYDDYSVSFSEYDNGESIVEGRLVTNPESNGRYHSDWCSMIYSRLLVSRDLLTKDGTIFISISDIELDNTLKICDEIFGADNFVNAVSVVSKNTAGASGGGEDKRLKKNVEYLLIYAKNYLDLNGFENVYSYTEIADLIDQYRKEGKSWKYTSVLKEPGQKVFVGETQDGEGNSIRIFKRENPEIVSINEIMRLEGLAEAEAYRKYGTKIFQTTNAQSSIRSRVLEARKELGIDDDLISIEYVPRSGKNKGKIYEQFYKGDQARLFVWLKDTSEEIDGVLYKRDALGTLWDMSGWMKNLTKEGSVAFPNGKKPVKLLKTILEMQVKEDDFVLDFFSGSASTAHAALEFEADGTKCHFIMVQYPEIISDNDKELYDFDAANVCDIGEERIRRAGSKIRSEIESNNNQLKLGEEPKPIPDTGFRVLRIDSSNFKDTYSAPDQTDQASLLDAIDNVKDGRTAEDILFQVLSAFRIPYSAHIEKLDINGKKVFDVNYGQLLACFDVDVTNDVIEEIARRKPSYAVMRDLSFKDDSAAANFEELFKTYSSDTIRRVI